MSPQGTTNDDDDIMFIDIQAQYIAYAVIDATASFHGVCAACLARSVAHYINVRLAKDEDSVPAHKH